MIELNSEGFDRLKAIKNSGKQFSKVFVPGLLMGLAANSSIAAGNDDILDDTALGSVAGQTELQRTSGNVIQTVCVNLVALGNTVTPDEAALRTACGEMVRNAVELNNATIVPGSLGLSSSELNAAIQNVATEEAALAGSIATEMSANQMTNLSSRLTKIRGGAGNLVVSGFQISVDGQALSYVDANSAARGGSAGGDELTGPWSFFLNGSFGGGEKDRTDRENGFDFDTLGVTAGADYRVSDSAIIGAALGWGNVDSDFNKTTSVSGGDVDTDAYSLSLYGTKYNDWGYIDGILSFGSNNYDMRRSVLVPTNTAALGADEVIKSSTDSGYFDIAVSAGMDFTNGALSYSPYARLEYMDIDIDGYKEKGSSVLRMTVEDQDVKSFTSALGVQGSYPISTNSGIFVPQASLEWIHEFEDDARDIVARYTVDPNGFNFRARTDEPDRDYANLNLGVSSVLSGGSQLFANFNTLLGYEDLDEWVVSFGWRTEL